MTPDHARIAARLDEIKSLRKRANELRWSIFGGVEAYRIHCKSAAALEAEADALTKLAEGR